MDHMSDGTRQIQEQIKRIAGAAERMAARRLLSRYNPIDLLKQKAGGLGRKLAAKAGKAAYHLVMKLIALLGKLLLTVFGSILSFFGFLLVILLPAVIVIVIGSFLLFDFNMDGASNSQDTGPIYNAYLAAVNSTVDMNKPEQLEWRVPFDLVAAFIQVMQLKEGKNIRSEEDYKRIALDFVNGLESKFTYKKVTLKSYRYSVTTYYDEKGNVSKTEKSSVTETATEVDTIEKVDTWRGIYKRKVTVNTPAQYTSSGKSENWKNGKLVSVTETFAKNETLSSEPYIYLEDYSRYMNQTNRYQGFGAPEIKVIDQMFNAKVSPKSEYATEREPIYVGDLYDTEGGTGFGLVDHEDIPPELLNAEYLWPVPDISRITSGFYKRVDPTNPNRVEFHTGIDISKGGGQSGGTPIYAMADGVVVFAGPVTSGYGQLLVIDHGNGLFSRYGHLQWDAYGVKAGDTVKKGDYIAQIGKGKVGRSTGPHLHFEVIINGKVNANGKVSGKFVNPLNFVTPPNP